MSGMMVQGVGCVDVMVVTGDDRVQLPLLLLLDETDGTLITRD